MSKTSEHLTAAIAALAGIEADGGGSAGATIYIHDNKEAQLYVVDSGGRVRAEQTDGGRRFTVASSVINSVAVHAFGPHKVPE